jgi:glycosyltransferase EpsJ
MANELVSVIVPAHNAGPTLRRCLSSVLAQTHAAIEVIAVNDGSTDDTRAILDELARSDRRLKVIHFTANAGIQAARAAAVRAATGAYVGFVDADDWVAPRMYAALLEHARSTDADIVLCNAVSAYDEGRLGPMKVKFRRARVIDDGLLDRFCRFEFGTGVLWNKLYRAPVIRPHTAIELGRDVESGEDYIVNIGCFAHAARVATLPETLYYYYTRPGSVSRAAANAQRFTRLLIAYVACLEAYAPSLRARFDAIDTLYARQLRLECYTVSPASQLLRSEPELRQILQRLAAVHPAGLYSLIHAFDASGEPRRRGFIAAAREISSHGRALLRSVRHVL